LRVKSALARFFHRLPVPPLYASPQPGDIISLRAVPDSGLYWLASVGRGSKTGTAVRVLSVHEQRPRDYDPNDLAPHDDPLILATSDFRKAEPRLVWRGPTDFWTEKPYVLED
jgi:hypothetical protein